MKKGTRFFALLLTLVMAMSVTACSAETTPADGDDNSAVVSAGEVETVEDSEPVVVDFTFEEPEGFTADPDDAMRLVAKDGSYIQVIIEEGSIEDWTQDSYEQQLKEYYYALYNESEEADLWVEQYDEIEVDEMPGVQALYGLSMYKNGVLQYTVERIIEVDGMLYTVRFVDVNKLSNVWIDAFFESAETIDFVWSDEVDLPADSTELVEYDSGKGLKLSMMEGMELTEVEGIDVMYAADTCMMSAVCETFEVAAMSGLDTESMSVEEYCELLITAYELFEPFSQDSYGNLATTYVQNVSGMDFFYYVTVRKSADAFWIINFACIDGQQDVYLPQFEQWASTITVE